MVIDLVGVIEDGGNASPGVPTNVRKTLRVVRGVDLTVRVQVLRRSGGVYRFKTDDQIVMTIKKTPNGQAFITKTVTLQEGISGVASVVITAAELKNLDSSGLGGRWVYDVIMSNASGAQRELLVPIGYVEVAATAAAL